MKTVIVPDILWDFAKHNAPWKDYLLFQSRNEARRESTFVVLSDIFNMPEMNHEETLPLDNK